MPQIYNNTAVALSLLTNFLNHTHPEYLRRRLPCEDNCTRNHSNKKLSPEAGIALAVIFGLFVCICCCSIYSNCFRKKTRRPNPLLTASLLNQYGRQSDATTVAVGQEHNNSQEPANFEIK